MSTSSHSASNAGKKAEQVGAKTQEAMQDLQGKAGEAVQSMKDMGTQAKAAVQDQFENLRGQASDYLEQGRDRAMEFEKSLEGQIREQPLKSALIALGIGFVLGVCFIRR